ncbi:DUF2799 domain-containing protein [Vibrio taketomensis]|uniref:DUF2799 domain-containing protein n=1 Tax=Vibrio taketomensis TaxID=2572923 RepID=UPI00138A255B|nr:DUF2799 domain-containing protein [Vibrio taketomensis]
MNWKLLAVTLLLVGCASVTPSLSNDPLAWQEFGQQQALDGQLMLSESKIVKHSLSGDVNSEQYKAYLDGYQMGQKTYCEQDARMLGTTGKPYRGICDDINPFFRSDYESTYFEL